MRLNKTQQAALKDIIKNAVDLSDYDQVQYKSVKDVFVVEGTGGSLKSVLNWLQGLPSALTIPFNAYEILQLLESIGVKVTDKNSAKLVENYWQIMAGFVYTMMMNGEI